jgi:hypothetical protein
MQPARRGECAPLFESAMRRAGDCPPYHFARVSCCSHSPAGCQQVGRVMQPARRGECAPLCESHDAAGRGLPALPVGRATRPHIGRIRPTANQLLQIGESPNP